MAKGPMRTNQIDPRDPADAGHQADASADQRRQAISEDRFLQAVYDEGIDEGKRIAKPSAKKSSSKRRTSSARREGRRLGRTVARSATSPVRGASTTGAQIIGLILAVIVVYLIVGVDKSGRSNAPTVVKMLDAVGTVFAWLRSPHTSIPANNSDSGSSAAGGAVPKFSS